MSGIVGLIRGDRAPLDRSLLQRLTEAMAFRAPDGVAIWSDGSVGLGHSLLRTTAAPEHQPLSLDGEIWITADARLDGRRDLIAALRAGGLGVEDLAGAPDPLLILHAYRTWGEECLAHLLGDFAFAIWDRPQRRLFCARDHFGVKPLFFARLGQGLIVSNTLSCVRQHPGVGGQLNELAIADFLLFGFNQDPSTSVFADIQRLPPGHRLSFETGELHIERYWSLPTDRRIRHRQPQDYVAEFKLHLEQAVADRLGAQQVGVLMSGGLDSTSVAAVAQAQLHDGSRPPGQLRAYTVIFDRLIPDRERHYSGLAAAALGIPIHYLVADDYGLYERWDQPELRTPEPCHQPLRACRIDQLRQIAEHGPVVLTGFGGDPALYYSKSFLLRRLKRLDLGALVTELASYLCVHRRLPGLGIRTAIKRWARGAPAWPYPAWLDRAFEARLELAQRWRHYQRAAPCRHSSRPEAYESLVHSGWANVFESYDAGWTGVPLEVRHPYFDLRLINYLLAIPPLTWFDSKFLLREAMRGQLPEAVRLRPKAVLAGDPEFELLRRFGPALNVPSTRLDGYVDSERIRRNGTHGDRLASVVNLRPLSLGYWLEQLLKPKCA